MTKPWFPFHDELDEDRISNWQIIGSKILNFTIGAIGLIAVGCTLAILAYALFV